MTLEDIAAELYALPSREFTAARDARARALRADRALAAAVKALRRPSAAAAAVNRLVRAEPERLATLFALGERMRAATAAGDPHLLSLGEQRRVLVSTLLARARELADAPVTSAAEGDVAATLEAAAASRDAARAVASGRLVKPIRYAGFGDLDLPDVVAVAEHLPDLLAPPRLRPTAAAEAGRKGATEALREAEAAEQLRSAAAAAEAARRCSDERARVAQEAALDVEAKQARAAALRSELAEAEHALAHARDRSADARRGLREAQSAAHSAEEALAAARARWGAGRYET